MANNGPNTNGSQFMIHFSPQANLNNKHTVFGRVILGYKIIENIEHGFNGKDYKPLKNVTIAECGEITTKLEKVSRATYLLDNITEMKNEFKDIIDNTMDKINIEEIAKTFPSNQNPDLEEDNDDVSPAFNFDDEIKPFLDQKQIKSYTFHNRTDI